MTDKYASLWRFFLGTGLDRSPNIVVCVIFYISRCHNHFRFASIKQWWSFGKISVNIDILSHNHDSQLILRTHLWKCKVIQVNCNDKTLWTYAIIAPLIVLLKIVFSFFFVRLTRITWNRSTFLCTSYICRMIIITFYINTPYEKREIEREKEWRGRRNKSELLPFRIRICILMLWYIYTPQST